MSEQGPGSGAGGSGAGKPPEETGAGRKLNGHLNGRAPAGQKADAGSTGPSVVIPFPKKVKPRPAWLSTALVWVALLAFAGVAWGVTKGGRIEIAAVAGAFGVVAAVLAYRLR